ncbi:hypothetical protein CEXT_693531 [Caerostris extrusa]|uniref:Uncharacterized protein n=1 Tax=Caerostris extrusa TaxID=172846 RepID=A0AAV4N072_CAEEX|nr:hypothetical protein CEXT_693531 [Caerostris extrusa]
MWVLEAMCEEPTAQTRVSIGMHFWRYRLNGSLRGVCSGWMCSRPPVVVDPLSSREAPVGAFWGIRKGNRDFTPHHAVIRSRFTRQVLIW